MTFVTISGNFFSLSVEQTAALCSIVFAEGLAHGWGLGASLVWDTPAGPSIVVAATALFVLSLAGAALRPVAAAVTLLAAARDIFGSRLGFTPHFDRLAGTDTLRLALEDGAPAEKIVGGWAAELEAFARRRAPHLRYA